MSEPKAEEDPSKYVKEIRDWLNQQPHLSKDLDDRVLLRFVHCCYYDVDKTKKTLETFLNIRTAHPEIFSNRDISSPEIQTMMKTLNMGLTVSGNTNIWLWQLNDENLQSFDYLHHIRLCILYMDAYFLNSTNLGDFDVVVYDGKDLTWKFLTKFNLSIARVVLKYQQDAIPLRLKQIHFVNASSGIYRVYSLIKPFMYKEVSEMFFFHPPNSQTLFDHVDKEAIPADFGGNQPPMAEFNERTLSILMNKKKKLLQETFWRNPVKKIDKPETNGGVRSFFRRFTFD